jgi:hypothetical protein
MFAVKYVTLFVSFPQKKSFHRLPRFLVPNVFVFLSEVKQSVRDEDTVRKALRVAWSEGAHPDEKDAEFLSQLRDWLGEDEALTLGRQLFGRKSP